MMKKKFPFAFLALTAVSYFQEFFGILAKATMAAAVVCAALLVANVPVVTIGYAISVVVVVVTIIHFLSKFAEGALSYYFAGVFAVEKLLGGGGEGGGTTLDPDDEISGLVPPQRETSAEQRLREMEATQAAIQAVLAKKE